MKQNCSVLTDKSNKLSFSVLEVYSFWVAAGLRGRKIIMSMSSISSKGHKLK